MRYFKTKAERDEKRAIIKKHTFVVGRLARWSLVDAVSDAVGAGGDVTLAARIFRTIFPKHRTGSSSFRRDYIADPNRYGRFVAHNGIKGRLAQKLRELKDGKTDEPFLVLRSAYPTSFFGQYSGTFEDKSYNVGARRLTSLRWYISQWVYDVISSGLLFALGAHHQPKAHGDDRVHRDYFTTPAAEIDQFSSDADFPRRFRQAVPEFALEDEPNAHEGHLTARYVVYVCVENPLADPLWVLPVRHVFKDLSKTTKEKLRESLFEFFDHWEHDLTARGVTMAQKIIGLDPNDWLSFDANRFNWDYEHTKAESYPAVGKLRSSIISNGLAKALPASPRRRT